MATQQCNSYAVDNLTPDIGSVIRADNSVLLSGQIAGEIRALLKDRGVILFPAVNFDDDEQVAFTKTLGTYKPESGSANGVFKVTMNPKAAEYAYYNQASFYWHIDGTMNDVPIFASLLSARQISPVGGETEFSNSYAAYDALSDEDKAMLEGLKAVHSFVSIAKHINPEPSYAEYLAWRRHPTKTLPLVWTHKSGRKSLILGNTAQYIVGMDPELSTETLIRLRDHATQPQFVYRHAWTKGDLVIWDNTGTMHRALPYPPEGGRLMHRTKLEGEEAFA